MYIFEIWFFFQLFPLLFRSHSFYWPVFKFADSSASLYLLLSPSSELLILGLHFTIWFFLIYIYNLPFYWSLFTETLSPYPYFCKHNFISLSSHHSLNSSSSEVSLSAQFTLWASSEADLVDFFRLWMGHSFPLFIYFFFMSHNFWLKTEHFRYYPVAALDTDPPTPTPRNYCFICLFVCLVTWLWLFRPGVNCLADRLVHRAGQGG